MIKFKHTETYGWEAAIRGMRNPLNSWAKTDSEFYLGLCPDIGSNDMSLMQRLRNAGTDHRKYLRMVTVTVDITAPLYWWKEFDTYRMGVEKNSCSTMHKIAAKEFTLGDFSHEHLLAENAVYFEKTIERLNHARERFLETKDKSFWWQMIQLLPSSYNQKRTVQMSYEAIANMYHARKAHKLDEWREGFCGWVKTLPYSELITGEE